MTVAIWIWDTIKVDLPPLGIGVVRNKSPIN